MSVLSGNYQKSDPLLTIGVKPERVQVHLDGKNNDIENIENDDISMSDISDISDIIPKLALDWTGATQTNNQNPTPPQCARQDDPHRVPAISRKR